MFLNLKTNLGSTNLKGKILDQSQDQMKSNYKKKKN